MKVRTLFCGWIIGLLGPIAAYADGQHVFWEVAGRHNTVYLMGSVHLLHGNDRALPAVAEAAYLDAETIVQELDIFAASAELAAGGVRTLQMLPDGQTLSEVLGPALYSRVQTDAAHLRINMGVFHRMQPWCVALVIMQSRLAQAGFSSSDGVDYQIALRAQRDRKPLRGLETITEQLSAFAGMPMARQVEFLANALDETDVARHVGEITTAWRHGNLARLESLLRDGGEESPDFFKALTTDRNLKWLPQIEAMLADPRDDYLVITGALHMVGEAGLVEQLRRRGYTVVRR